MLDGNQELWTLILKEPPRKKDTDTRGRGWGERKLVGVRTMKYGPVSSSEFPPPSPSELCPSTGCGADLAQEAWSTGWLKAVVRQKPWLLELILKEQLTS